MAPIYDAHLRTFAPIVPSAFGGMINAIDPWVKHTIPLIAVDDSDARSKGLELYGGFVDTFGAERVVYSSLIPRDGRGNIKDQKDDGLAESVA